MLRNYFKIALRNLLRHKLFSFINVFGLALGMAGALLIGLWVTDELGYNRFYPELDRLYFVRMSNGDFAGNQTSAPLADALKQDIPAVEKATKLSWLITFLVEAGEKAGKEEGFYASDDFFDVFQLPVLQGDPGAALRSPNQIVITRKVAEVYFGTVNAVGKQLRLKSMEEYVVGAVIENVPSRSSVRFDWVVNFKEFEQDWMRIWSNYSFRTYVKLRPNVTQAQAEASMRHLVHRYDPDPRTKKIRPILQPLGNVYLYGEYANGKPVGGRIEYVRTFTLVSLLILLIACVNFMNLSTARSAGRAREVGIRKVSGAARYALIGQFLGESLLMSLLALVLALAMATLALPGVNALTQKQLTLDLMEPMLWLGLLTLAVVAGLLAGSYPALFLSSLQPIRVLKGTFKTGLSAALFRKGLVVFQFSLSVLLIVGMLVVNGQMHYIRTKHLGLNRENLLYVLIEGNLWDKREAVQQELLRSRAIGAVTTTGELPVNIGSNTSGNLVWPGKNPDQVETVWQTAVGHDFIKTMQIQLLAGRDFRRGYAADTANVLINESAARLMNMPDPVGQEITFQGQKGRIIGLMKDFHLASLHSAIQPLVIRHNPNWTNYLVIRTQPGQTPAAIEYFGQTLRQLNPDYPFDYHFLDQAYDRLYRSENLVNHIVNAFGLLAIVISCLGLFGLAAFTAEQRTKEMSIRKVLGASVGSLVRLLSGDFLRLVLLAILVASPVAWYAAHQWLQDFEYRINLEWWMFALAGGIAVLIALLTVSFQSVKAALANPAHTLRSE